MCEKDRGFEEIGLEGIAELMKRMRENGVTRLDLETEGMKLSLQREAGSGAFLDEPPPTPARTSPAVEAVRAPAATPVTAPGALAAPEIEAPVGHLVKSPIVGIFYAAPSPDAAPFVTPGATVTPGQTLCIIEAMKLMNEVNSPVAGTVTEVLVKNGDRVEFGQPMLRIV